MFTKMRLSAVFLLMLLILVGCGGGAGGGAGAGGTTNTKGTSSLTLSWDTPKTRMDGTPLSSADIVNYEIHYGTSANVYTTTIPVGNSQSYTITGLNSGTTYHFSVSCEDSLGNKSGYSADVAKAI